MKIVRSRYAGACYGVERALSLVDKAARAAISTNVDAPVGDSGHKTASHNIRVDSAMRETPSDSTHGAHGTHTTAVYTLGPLIHNPQVVHELQARGVKEVRTVEEADAGTLVIRSHGVAPAVIEQAHARGLQVIDATCPHVSKAQEAARHLREQGYLVMVVGELGHPEVEGIRAYAGDDAIVVQEPTDLPKELTSEKIGIVVQTTQAADALKAIVDALQRRNITPTVRDTICFATRQRQEAAAELASTVDVMVVVGGRNSGNTTRLAKLCQAVCPQTYHIESVTEIDPHWFEKATLVGITAGASTPENQIIAVEQALERLP
jgi:4-hydroxy-3-methylbut-2-enyl diphosphate reductase